MIMFDNSLSQFWIDTKKHLYCFFHSTGWLILSAIGLIIPIVLYYIFNYWGSKLNEEFEVGCFLFNDKNLLVYCLSIIITSALMYKSKSKLCNSKFMKEFALFGFIICFIIGFSIFQTIITGNINDFSNTTMFITQTSWYSGLCISYSFVLKYYLFNNSDNFKKQNKLLKR